MIYTDQAMDKAKEIVSCYNKFDEISNLYFVDIEEIIDYPAIEELAGLIFSSNPEYSIECIKYQYNSITTMLQTTLVRHMINQEYDESSFEDICNSLISGIIRYQVPIITELLNSILDDYNEQQGDI